MKRTLINGLVASLSLGMLAACGGGNSGSASQASLMATTVACNPAWVSTTAYTGGAKVSYANVNYTANWWTQGQNPSTNNGGAGSGQPWTSNGACGGTTPTPTPTPAPTPTPTPAPTPTPTPTPAPAPTPTPTGWTLGWSDEFNGTALDTSKWNIEVNGTGEGNAELEYYTNRTQNVSVSGGNLVITARQETYTGPDGTKSYTSGRINSSGKFSQAYGRMEARMKMPVGQGLWPAFWMLGANIGSVGWPKCGEIDIMEHINTEAMIHGTIHWADVNGNHVQYGNPSGNVDVTQWHTYAVEWDTNQITWFIDGTQYMAANIQNNINNTGAFHNPFFLIFNLAVGGSWPGNPNGSVAFPQQMLVDYVRVYHK